MTYEKGDMVKYAKPLDKQEAALRFVVIEDRDARLLVDVCGVTGLGMQNCFAKSEYELVEA